MKKAMRYSRKKPEVLRWREDPGAPGPGLVHHGFCKECKTPLTGKKHFHDTSTVVQLEDGRSMDDAYCEKCFFQREGR